MSSSQWALVAVFLVSLLVAAFASASQAALATITRRRVQKMADQGMRRAALLDRLMERANVLLPTVIILHTLATVTAAVAATVFIAELLNGSASNAATIALAVAVTTVILLVLAETLPKAVAVQHPEGTALMTARPLAILAWLFTPIAGLLKLVSRPLLLAFGQRPAGTALVTEEEVRQLVALGEEAGTIQQEERAMIHGVLELEETTAREIMVPRIDIVAAEQDVELPAIAAIVIARGYSRIPLYDESMDHITGVVYAKDLLPYFQEGRIHVKAKDIARAPYFIPESKKIDELLDELQKRQVHMAIVVDEYGGTAGLVTIEDLLEEIVGEIQDEYDHEEVLFEWKIPDQEAVMDARVSIDELSERFHVAIEEGDYDTINGFVQNQLGKIPVVGDEIQYRDLNIYVMATMGRRIKRVRVRRGAPALTSPAEAANGSEQPAESQPAR